MEKYPSDPPFNDGLGCEDALADGRELHAPPCVAPLLRSRSYFSVACCCCCCCYYGDVFWGQGGACFSPPRARVLPGLFNSAHPIIRDRESTSSRPRSFFSFSFFFLACCQAPQQSARTDRGGTHWLSRCCYVLRLLGAEEGEESRPLLSRAASA